MPDGYVHPPSDDSRIAEAVDAAAACLPVHPHGLAAAHYPYGTTASRQIAAAVIAAYLRRRGRHDEAARVAAFAQAPPPHQDTGLDQPAPDELARRRHQNEGGW
jgi:hypothetical protein